ncbi:MAG: peptidoglycan DD-metalloendopeptidase family protein [Oscillospiraceae bacterium]|jgi:murein DD-endopeptidase MepM/ murein hydrolase activator NlpD
MDENKSSGKTPKRFFDGKGFYIALAVCVAVIGASVWYLLRAGKADVEDAKTQNELAQVQQAPEEDAEHAVPDTVIGDDAQVQTSAQPDAKTDEKTLDEQTETNETAALGGGSVETAAQPGWVWPVSGKIDVPYSVTALIYNKKLGDWRTHDGIDLTAKPGEKVCAAAAGTVESVERDDMNGMTVIIAHEGGLRTIYANLEDTPTVVKGDSVMQGETIGSVGVTAAGETKENTHLLFKMTLDGQSVDPKDYLPAR